MSGSTEDTMAAPSAATDPTQADDARTRPLQHQELLEPGTSIGRYLILAKLGAGGMGVVYAAYDPELDRKVALKLLRGESEAGSQASEGRTRLLREAQALAKLAHPEVVAIHDVGEHQAGVWLAMEHVDGETLGVWAKRLVPSWREVLAVMLAAGRGVAAAHAAGLVHRDLKPDNIMISADGRVRVMDFGLTRSQERRLSEAPVMDQTSRPNFDAHGSQLTAVGSLLGTPAYMAPEQFAGLEVGPAADQWSFCVTAWELLFGERPFVARSMMELASAVLEGRRRAPPKSARHVPAWLRRVLDRGMTVAPDQRWPSMAALLTELERGQARRRNRIGVAALGVLALAVVGIEGFRRHDVASRVGACEAEGEAIRAVWNPDIAEQVHASLLATKVPYAETTSTKLLPWFDQQADEWAQHRTEACLAATVEGSFDAELREKSSWCLDERQLEFASQVEQALHADAQVVERAVLAAAGLSRTSPCLDPVNLASQPAPPSEESRPAVGRVQTQLAEANARFAAGKYDETIELLESVAAEAEATDWPPLVASGLRLRGAALSKLGRAAEAEASLEQAYVRAATAGAWEVAAEAATQLITAVGNDQARLDEGLVWADHAAVALAHAHDGLGLREARRLNGLGIVLEAKADYPGAKAAHERSIEMVEAALGPEHPQAAIGYNNLSLVLDAMGEETRASAMLQRALEIRERAVGPDHPGVADLLTNLAATLDDPLEARALHERALKISERALGPEHLDVADSLMNLATTYSAVGDYEQAKSLLLRALEIRADQMPDHPDRARALANLANVYNAMGDQALAKSTHEQALAIFEAALGSDHPDVAQTLSNLANAEYELGEFEQSRAHHERGLAIREAVLGPDHFHLAHPLTGLARIAIDQRRFADAVVLAERAVRVRGGDGVRDSELAESRFVLAEALWGDGEQARAVELARLARAGFVASPDGADKAEQVDAWLEEHAAP